MLWKVPLLSENSIQCVYSVKRYLNDKFSFLFFVFLSTLSSIFLVTVIMTLHNVCLSINKISLREGFDCCGLFL